MEPTREQLENAIKNIAVMFHIPPITYKEIKCPSYLLKLLQLKSTES